MITAKYIYSITKNIIPAKDRITKHINKAQKKYISIHKKVKSKLNIIKPTNPIKEINTLNIITMIGCLTFIL